MTNKNNNYEFLGDPSFYSVNQSSLTDELKEELRAARNAGKRTLDVFTKALDREYLKPRIQITRTTMMLQNRWNRDLKQYVEKEYTVGDYYANDFSGIDLLAHFLKQNKSVHPHKAGGDAGNFCLFGAMLPPDDPDAERTDSGQWSKKAANVIAQTCMVFDIDSKTIPFTIEEFQEAFADYQYIIYTTHSHTPEQHRYRAIIPLLDPARPTDFTDRKDTMLAMYPYADKVSFNGSQGFYMPIHHPDREADYRFIVKSVGKLYDLFEIEKDFKEEFKPRFNHKLTSNKTREADETVRTTKGWMSVVDIFDKLSPGGKLGGVYRDSSDKKPGAYLRRGSGEFEHLLFFFAEDNTKIQTFTPYQTDRTPNFVNQLDKLRAKGEKKRKERAAAAAAKNLPLFDVEEEEQEEILLKPAFFDKTQRVQDVVRIETNDEYLDESLIPKIYDHGITFIKSGTGTGKTELFKHAVAHAKHNNKSVLSIGHRVALLQNLSKRTGLDFYQESEGNSFKSHLAVCINSLPRFVEAGTEYDILVIDESDQLFINFLANTLHRNRGEVLDAFRTVLKRVKHILCLDAHLSPEITISLINFLTEGNKELRKTPALLIDNLFRKVDKDPENLKKIVFSTQAFVVAQIQEALLNNERTFVASNTLAKVYALENLVKDRFPEKKMLIFTSDNHSSPEHVEFLLNPETESLKYDIVMASPTMSTGVSITGGTFERVFGLFTHNPGTVFDHIQALDRVRNMNTLTIYVAGNREVKHQEYETYVNILQQHLKYTLNNPESLQDHLSTAVKSWHHMSSLIREYLHLHSHFKDELYIEIMGKEGYEFEIGELPDGDPRNETSELAEYKVDRKLLIAERLFDSRIIEQHEYEALLEKKNLEEGEFYQRLRYELSFKIYQNEYYRYVTLEELHEALIQNVDKTQWDYKIYYKENSTQRKRRDEESFKKNITPGTTDDISNHNKMKIIAERCLAIMEIKHEDIIQAHKEEGDFEFSTAQLFKLTEHVYRNCEEYNAIFKKHIKRPAKDMSEKDKESLRRNNQLNILNNMVGSVLTFKVKGDRTGKGANRKTVYKLNKKQNEILHGKGNSEYDKTYKDDEEDFTDLTNAAKEKLRSMKK